MTIFLTYYHWSGNIGVSFSPNAVEEWFAVGFGSASEEAESNFRGWFGRNSEVARKFFLTSKEKPYLAVMTKREDGKLVRMKPSLNVFKDMPGGEPNQITVRTAAF